MPDEMEVERKNKGGKGPRHTVWLIAGAVICLLLVAGFGFYQFSHRAAAPIDLVKAKTIKSTGAPIGKGILDFIKAQGIKVVSEGFKPTWGAEQISRDVWEVSYVFEVGRQSHWATWTVNTRTGSVQPRDALASQIQQGKR